MLARTLLFGSAPYHLSLLGRAPAATALRFAEPWPGEPVRGAALLKGEFAFGDEVVHGAVPPWSAVLGATAAAELHGFQWLNDLAAAGSGAAAQAARDWTVDWLRQCDAWDGIAWRADVMGHRLFAWLEHFPVLAGGPEDGLRRTHLLASVARQARHLARVASREAAGVGRLAALRGLIAAAAALGSQRRVERAVARLEREIALQILPDGGHVERNPETQLRALRYLIDARSVLRALHHEIPVTLQSAIDRAAPMLRFFRHGDGMLALFNGASEGDIHQIDLVLGRAEAKGRPPTSAPYAGFQRLHAVRSLVIMDAGVPPAGGFDRNAHAGTLSFELSHGRERIIVNCGGYHGESPDWRKVARATAAHSTLVVADTNSSETTADGRLGRHPTHVPSERAEEDGSQWLAASHDGYQPLFGLSHSRRLFLAADGDDLRGEDRLVGRAGQGFAIRFHFHPEVQASLTQDRGTALLRLADGMAWRLRAEGALMSLSESVYLGSGVMRKSHQLVLEGHVGSAGATVKWALRRDMKQPQDV